MLTTDITSTRTNPRMFSFQERMRTFRNWPKDYGVATPENLAIAGFVCVSTEDDNLTVRCVYCEKTLESWESTDLPVKEHYLHMTKCPLFNMNQVSSRISTFRGWEGSDIRVIARNGFVRYNLRNSDFIFCYKCGSIDQSHVCRRLPGSVYNVKKHSSIFFYELLEGKYNEAIIELLKMDLYIPNQFKERMRELTCRTSKNAVLRSIDDAITEYINTQMASVEKMLNDDIQNAMNEVFDARLRKHTSTKDLC